MAEIVFRAPTPADITEVSENMRAADLAEIAAAGSPGPRQSAEQGVRRSVLCWTATVDGRVACILGVAPLRGLLDDMGVPWLLGTDLTEKHARALIRRSPAYIAQMLRAYPHLLNFVHARNTSSVRWLRRAGFTLQPAAPYGPHGELFHFFEMRA